jgi:hypothetical protein
VLDVAAMQSVSASGRYDAIDDCLLGFQSYYPDDDFVESSFHRQIVAFEGCLSPAYTTSVVRDLDEQPAWLDAEAFDGLDLCHSL